MVRISHLLADYISYSLPGSFIPVCTDISPSISKTNLYNCIVVFWIISDGSLSTCSSNKFNCYNSYADKDKEVSQVALLEQHLENVL